MSTKAAPIYLSAGQYKFDFISIFTDITSSSTATTIAASVTASYCHCYHKHSQYTQDFLLSTRCKQFKI